MVREGRVRPRAAATGEGEGKAAGAQAGQGQDEIRTKAWTRSEPECVMAGLTVWVSPGQGTVTYPGQKPDPGQVRGAGTLSTL